MCIRDSYYTARYGIDPKFTEKVRLRSLDQHQRRKAAKVSITPAQMAQIRAIYKLRATLTRETGVLHHVDHHIPLSKGGLHVPENLWVITAAENLSKGDRLP